MLDERTTMTHRVNMTLEIETQNRAGYWAALWEPTGVVGYGATEEEAQSSLEEAIDTLLESFAHESDPVSAAKAYLDFHKVRHTIKPLSPTSLFNLASSGKGVEAFQFAKPYGGGEASKRHSRKVQKDLIVA